MHFVTLVVIRHSLTQCQQVRCHMNGVLTISTSPSVSQSDWITPYNTINNSWLLTTTFESTCMDRTSDRIPATLLLQVMNHCLFHTNNIFLLLLQENHWPMSLVIKKIKCYIHVTISVVIIPKETVDLVLNAPTRRGTVLLPTSMLP